MKSEKETSIVWFTIPSVIGIAILAFSVSHHIRFISRAATVENPITGLVMLGCLLASIVCLWRISAKETTSALAAGSCLVNAFWIVTFVFTMLLELIPIP